MSALRAILHGMGEGITTVYTAYSVYQVDQGNRRIRRHASTHEPTRNQTRYTAADEWERYERIAWIANTHELLIVWGVDAEVDICRRTRTSQVRQIDGPPIDERSVDVRP